MRNYSGKQISRAGETLTQDDIVTTNRAAYDEAMEILSYWRTCHEEPLTRAVALLRVSAQKFDNKALVAKRLKRTPSIISKLQRFPGMKLRNMQDIGGCRAILSNEKRVRKLVRDLKNKMGFRIKDYISEPKEDGYRSVHLVGDFSNGAGGVMPIELQVRTSAQHAWATAVEIIDLFTGQAIKANKGTSEWRKFFKCAGDQLALIEDVHMYNQMPLKQLAREIYLRLENRTNTEKHRVIADNTASLYFLGEKLGILEQFNAYTVSLKAADDHLARVEAASYALLEINTVEHSVSSNIFTKDEFSRAAEAYLASEKQAAISKGIVVALVSADAIGGIKDAYPNYFADSSLFIQYLNASVEAYRHYNPTAVGRFVKRLFG